MDDLPRGAGRSPLVLARVETAVTGAFVLTVSLLLIALSRVADGIFNGSISVANAHMADFTEGVDRNVGFARLGVANNLG